ncbi:hypothetical protein [Devosia sp.]|uniref:hypothetical protein n=1 Tax=Devosia sp. TaxID=1871048 RepID=UPI003265C36A
MADIAIKSALIVGMIAVLAGCTASAERKMFAEADVKTCTEYGFKPGTDSFGQCRLQLDGRRDAAYAQIASNIGSAPVPTFTPLMAPQSVQAPNRNVSCTSNRVGNTVQTNCY